MAAIPDPPIVSVLIAAFNAELFIANAINSALAQTEQRVEVIVVDDGSTDTTLRVAHEIAAHDARVVVLGQDKNRGVSAARNAALAVARGLWIAVLDADDAFAPRRLEVLLQRAELLGADMIADNLEMHDFKTNAPLGRAFPDSWMLSDHDINLGYLLERDIPGMYDREIGFFKPIIRREFLVQKGIQYNEEIYAAEDFLLYAECLLKGARLRFIPEALYLYAKRTGSLSSLKKSNESCKKVCDILLGRLAGGDIGDIELLRLRRHATNYELLVWHLKHGRLVSAAGVAAEMPFLFTLRRLTTFSLRKLGLRLANPTLRNLEVIKQRSQGIQTG